MDDKDREILELRACLCERGDFISHLELLILNRKYGYPDPPPYKLESKEYYVEQVVRLDEP